MQMQFKPATKTQAKARIALAGPSGSGKTYTALLLAQAMGVRIALVDTERGSASKYAGDPGIPAFDVLELESFSPSEYMAAIEAAEAVGYDVLILDSISHAWSGKDGILEQVDVARAKSKSGNAFTDGWRSASPLHNKFVDRMLASKLHLIATMRSHTQYVLDESNGKKIPRKVGMEPVQRKDIEYEFDLMGELDIEHTLVVTKSRCQALDGQVFSRPGEDLGSRIMVWLTDGAPMPERLPTPPPGPQNGAGATKSPTAHGKKSYGLGAEESALLAQIQTVAKAIVGTDGTMDARQEAGRVLYKECFGSRVWATVQALPLADLEAGLARLQAKVTTLPPGAGEGEGMASPEGIRDVQELAASLGASALVWGPGQDVTLESYTTLLDYLEKIRAIQATAHGIGIGAEIDGTLSRSHAAGKRLSDDALQDVERNLAARAKGEGA